MALIHATDLTGTKPNHLQRVIERVFGTRIKDWFIHEVVPNKLNMPLENFKSSNEYLIDEHEYCN